MQYARLVLTLLTFATSLFAQNPNAPLIAAIAAHGGAAVASVQTIRIVGHRTNRGSTEVVRISANIPEGEMRVDYGDPVTSSHVTPGVRAGIPPFELTSAGRRNKQAFVGVFGQLDILSGLGLSQFTVPAADVANLGTASVNGRTASRFGVRSGRQQTHYFRALPDAAEVQIDSQTSLVSAISRTFSAEQNLDHTFVRTYVFSDFRNVRGLVFPFQIDTQIDGSTSETLVVDSVELNPALALDLFRN
jgi:hypothetical protein